jgi:serine/threonine protein kinase
MNIVKSISKINSNEERVEVLKISKEESGYFVYKRNNEDNNEHFLLSLLRISPNKLNIKRLIINEVSSIKIENKLYSKFRLYKQGDLFSFIESVNLSRLSIDRIMVQLLSAVNYIHELGIIHRDIKTENILINDNGDIILCDFENATLLRKEYMYDSICGTFDYLCSDILLYGRYSKYTDLYSCMIILLKE